MQYQDEEGAEKKKGRRRKKRRGPIVYHHWTVQQTIDFLRSGHFVSTTSSLSEGLPSSSSTTTTTTTTTTPSSSSSSSSSSFLQNFCETLLVVDEKERPIGDLPLCLLVCAPPSSLLITLLPRQKSAGYLVLDVDPEGSASRKNSWSDTDTDDDNNKSGDDTSAASSPRSKPRKHFIRNSLSTSSSGGGQYFLPIMTVVKKRIGWLMLLFLAETFTGSVLRMFENELSQVVALSFFVPLLIGTGGNSGSQVVTTVVRALATKKITTRSRDVMKVIVHELTISSILGSILGIVGFVRALIWGTETVVAFVVGLTLPLIVMWANTVGSVVPMLVVLLGQDPAVVSAPFITTLVDATGLAIYFSLAKWILEI